MAVMGNRYLYGKFKKAERLKNVYRRKIRHRDANDAIKAP